MKLTADTHKWTIFLTSAATPPPEPKSSTDAPPVEIDKDYIPGGEDDMTYLIKRVVFRLHDTYPTPNRSECQISLSSVAPAYHGRDVKVGVEVAGPWGRQFTKEQSRHHL